MISSPVCSVSLFFFLSFSKLMTLETVGEEEADYFYREANGLITQQVRKMQHLLSNQIFVAFMNAHTFGVATVDARYGIFSPFLSTKSSVPGIPAAILNAEYYRENMNPNLLANYLGVRSAHEIPFTYFYIHDPNPNAY